MKIVEGAFEITPRPTDWLGAIEDTIRPMLHENETVLRVVVTKSNSRRISGDVLVLEGRSSDTDLFYFDKRQYEDTSTFNAVIMIPTGIGAQIGGHDGDAGPVVKLFGSICDTVVTHPNVVNASDINEMTENTLYVEGSVLTELMMGKIGLQPSRNNNVLVIVDDDNPFFTNASINAVNAARVSYGFRCPKVIKLKPSFQMVTNFAKSGCATGELLDINRLFDVLDAEKGQFDAVALSTHMTMPEGYRDQYFAAPGNVVNLWGGAGSMLTHAISQFYEVPSAHAPMARTMDEVWWGEVSEPRLAAETVSLTFLQGILKGLQRSPQIVREPAGFPGMKMGSGFFDVSNVSVLVIPDGCIGLPTLAALKQGIAVIAVGENKNLMQNDLDALPWKPGQFHRAGNYLNAAGIAAALKAGIDLALIRRPIRSVKVETRGG